MKQMKADPVPVSDNHRELRVEIGYAERADVIHRLGESEYVSTADPPSAARPAAPADRHESHVDRRGVYYLHTKPVARTNCN